MAEKLTYDSSPELRKRILESLPVGPVFARSVVFLANGPSIPDSSHTFKNCEMKELTPVWQEQPRIQQISFTGLRRREFSQLREKLLDLFKNNYDVCSYELIFNAAIYLPHPKRRRNNDLFLSADLNEIQLCIEPNLFRPLKGSEIAGILKEWFVELAPGLRR